MRASILFGVAVLLAGCRTSNLGACASDNDCATGVCDLNQHVCVLPGQTGGPSISGISFTPAGVTDASGNRFIGPGAGPVSVQATITAPTSVAASSVCLRISGETGACAHPGTAGASDTYTFSLPRPAPPQDGRTPLKFTLEAADTAQRQTRLPQSIFFDYQGPSISVTPDSTPYARTAVAIPVTALIADPSGVPDGGVFLNGTIAPASRDGGLFTFSLDPRGADAGVEGPYAFQVSAVDNLANASDAGASRMIDDAPPALAVQIYKDVPDGGGVTYPAAVPGTGWDGTQFVYSDTVHVKGTLTDVSGIGSATVHVDGIDVDGGVTRGAPIPLGCGGTSPCTFDVQVTLNSPDAGAFNTGSSMHAMGDINAPSGPLAIVVDAADSARSADTTVAAHSTSTSLAAQTTRLLWQMYLPNSVSGLAIHPNGDVIVTLDGGVDTVWAMNPADGGVHWTWGSDAGAAGIGAIDGTPAIGTGSSSTARIYVAGEAGDVYALDPTGAAAWHYSTGDTLNVGPAVTSATVNAATVEEVIVDGALATSSIYGIYGNGSTGTLINSRTVGDANASSAPFVFSGGVFFANASQVEKHTISAAGALGAASQAGAAGSYFELITDGISSVYDWRLPTNAANGGLNSRAASNLGNRWGQTVTPSGAPAITLEGSLLVPLSGGAVGTFLTSNGNAVNSALINLGGSGHAPLIGWDGQQAHEHFYFTRDVAVLFAYDSAGNLSWEADPNGNTYRTATMDCSGRVFSASNEVNGSQSLVYALISDDRGMANTAWPSYRIDARNTGNAVSTFGMLTSTCSQ